jgi:hypothetical protein
MGNCYGGSTVPAAYGTYGAGVPYGGTYGAIDADPITPGIQATPGVVTPVGPPQVVGGPAIGGAIGVPPAIGLGTTTVGVPPIGVPSIGVPQIGAPSVGFQQTSFQTTSAPFVQGGFRPPIAGQVGGFTTSFPTGGIQRPGFGVGAPGFGGFGAGIDMDPISPGIQTRPGVVTATGPSFRI